jgi:hypothetical protein
MTEQSVFPKPDTNSLLKEYELCHKAAQRAETTIWQTSGAIGLGLVGSLLLTATRALDDPLPGRVAILAGVTSFAFAFIWWLIARRLWSIQHVMFLRMRHIEKDIGLHANRYVQYIDDLREGDPARLESSGLPDDQKRDIRDREAKRVFCRVPDHQRMGTKPLIGILPFLLLLFWIGYAFVVSARW